MRIFLRRVNAQITILAALIFSIVISLIVTTINAAAFSVGFLRADLITYAGVSSEFSQFFRPLADNFNIFGLEIIDGMENEMAEYMQRSVEKDTSLLPVKLSAVKIKNSARMTDNCGIFFKNQIVKYMKYKTASDFINVILGNEQYKKKCAAVKELNDSLAKGFEILSDMDKNLVRAASCIDGIAYSDDTFACVHNAPVTSNFPSLKMLTSTKKPADIGIIDDRVYASAIVKNQLLSDCLIKATLDIYSETQEKYYIKDFENLVKEAALAGREALKFCDSYKNNKTKLKQFTDDYNNQIEKNRKDIGDEIADSFKQECASLGEYGNDDKKELFDVNRMIPALERNIQTLDVIEELLLKISYVQYDDKLQIVNEIANIISGYSCADMVVDYSEVKFVSNNSILSKLKKMYSNIGKGIVDIVAQGHELSSSEVNISTLAVSQYSVDKDKAAASNTSLVEKLAVVEYLSDNFDCFADCAYDDGGLKYDMEFILIGQNNDRDNFSRTVKEMAAIREGANLICLMADYQKKQEAYAMAAGLLGFTGMAGIIKLGQYLIMTAWAYSESIMDVKRLVNGEKLELIKSRNDWRMTLEKMLTFDYSYEKSSRQGMFGYKDYLKMLIISAGESAIFYRTMAAMEMRLIALGYEDFRMKNFLVKISGQVEFLIRGQTYEKQFCYEY